MDNKSLQKVALAFALRVARKAVIRLRWSCLKYPGIPAQDRPGAPCGYCL